MVLKNASDDTTDARSCECGDHADIVDGVCRRCALPEGDGQPEEVLTTEDASALVPNEDADGE